MDNSNTSPSPLPPPSPPPPPPLPPPPPPPPPRLMQQDPFPPLSYAQVWARPPPLPFVTSGAWSPGKVADPSPNSSGQPTTTGRHATYRGARCRAGKWVSEIREPGKARRIWLGTYPKAEMAAVAYDVAALALKGADAVLNFPDAVNSYPLPASASPSDIQAAAAAAAAALPLPPSTLKAEAMAGKAENNLKKQEEEEHGSVFMDEEEIFNMPKLIESMAEGMLMTPPRMSPNDSPKASDEGESLWNYYP